MEKSEMSHLMETQEALKRELWELQDKAASLDLENQEIAREMKHMNEENKSLEEKVTCFKTMVKDLEKEEQELQEMLRKREETRVALQVQNQNLAETNRVLCSRIQKVSSKLVTFQESKAIRDQGMLCIRQVMEQIVGYFKQLEARIETTQHLHEDEKKQCAELTHTVVELEEICIALENQVHALEEQLEQSPFSQLETDSSLEGPSLLQEMVQAKLSQDSRGLKKTVTCLLSLGMWVLLATIISLVVSDVLLSIFAQDLAPRKYLMTLANRPAWVTKILSPYSVRRLSGLRPF
ncbi:transmembrane and coiled-coil domain-containing protein 5B-like [Erythrolamprus reginae]|uniref:transmembrane and coiled-coil domain-containing protein 5B-like n=1 Tax=Erythrolamprus reginae TaxID=121349 RepID=UPI00396CA642